MVHGDVGHSRAVVDASRELPDFPAHRVLPPGGRVPTAWANFEWIKLLAVDGIAVDADCRAPRKHHISWDVLAERRDAGGLAQGGAAFTEF